MGSYGRNEVRVRVKSAYVLVFFFQAEDGIRDLVRSRGLGDVYKRQVRDCRKFGIQTHANFLVGLPGETRESALRSIEFALSLIHI